MAAVPPPSAPVLIGPLGGTGVRLVQDFYRGCPFEVMGPGSIAITAVDTFLTLEDLVDKLLARTDSAFVIVNHGNTRDGLLMPFLGRTTASATGRLIDDLGTLAGQSAPSPGDQL